jgi:hypothetical protein
MARRFSSTTLLIWFGIAAFIALNLFAAALGLEPPPVPLDPEGHTAPYSDSPLFGL